MLFFQEPIWWILLCSAKSTTHYKNHLKIVFFGSGSGKIINNGPAKDSVPFIRGSPPTLLWNFFPDVYDLVSMDSGTCS